MTSYRNKCPSCGSNEFKEARQCPIEDDHPVCIDCCKRCRYYNSDPIAIPCRFSLDNPVKKIREKIVIVEKEIKKKENFATHFYKINRPDFAKREEQQLVWIYEEKRKLLKELRDAEEREEQH